MAVTLQKIADRVGVHRTVVSRVLNNSVSTARVSKEKAEQIRKVASELGYRRNAFAHATVTGECNTIALLLSTVEWRSLAPGALLSGLVDALAEHDMHLSLAALPDEKLIRKGVIPQVLREYASQGLLINYNAAIPEELIRMVKQSSAPYVWINSKHDCNCVYIDDRHAACQAARELIGRGHRAIPYLSFGEGEHYSFADRLQGYRDAMAQADLEPQVIHCTSDRSGKVQPVLRKIFAGDDRPTAVIGYNPEIALNAYQVALDLGLQVPEDISVMTFSVKPRRIGNIVLGAMQLPETALAHAAVRQLLNLIHSPGEPMPPVAFKAQFKPGTTVAGVNDAVPSRAHRDQEVH